MSATLPPGVTIAKPQPELKLGGEYDNRHHDYLVYHDDRDRADILHDASAFPTHCVIGSPQEIMAKLFACSGSLGSSRYREATKFRAIPDMGWEEARIALARLQTDVSGWDRAHRTTTEHYVALAEFALTVYGFQGFNGRRGEHAVKLRGELAHVIQVNLQHHLRMELHGSADTARVFDYPITNRLQGEGWRGNAVLWAKVPTSACQWVRIIEATPAQVIASLGYLRTAGDLECTAPVRRRGRHALVVSEHAADGGGICRGDPHRGHARPRRHEARHTLRWHHAFDANLSDASGYIRV